MFDKQVLLQYLQMREVLHGCVTLPFFLCRLAPKAWIFSLSSCLTPVFTGGFHSVLSSANFSQDFASMWHLFRLLLHVSLNLSFGRPLCLQPCANSPYSSCLGILLSSILFTCPSHLSLLLHKIVGILESAACLRTSKLVTLSCQIMSRILRRHLRWKTLSLFSCLVYNVQVSDPSYNK